MENIHEMYFYKIDDFIVTGQRHENINKWYHWGNYIYYVVQLIFSFLLPKYNYAQSGTTQKLVQLSRAGTTRKLVQLHVILFSIILNVHHVLHVYHVLNILVETLMSSSFTSGLHSRGLLCLHRQWLLLLIVDAPSFFFF